MFHKKLLQHDTNWVVAHSKESQIFFKPNLDVTKISKTFVIKPKNSYISMTYKVHQSFLRKNHAHMKKNYEFNLRKLTYNPTYAY